MKSNGTTIKLIITALVICVAFASCKKGFDKLSDDPNNPKEVPTSYYLTGAEKGLMDNTADHFWNGTMGSQLAQYWASNLYTEESRYQYLPDVINSHWAGFYAGGTNDISIQVGGLMELQQIINLCNSNPAKYSATGYPKNQIAVATILQVWGFQNITDVWGDVPYSEALKGVALPAPKYDKQKDIYNGLLAQLDSANAWIDNTQPGPAGDVIYGGDMGLWKKFCNSLKLRVAIRIADQNSALASQKINEAVAAGIFTSNSDNAVLNYLSSQPNTNPIWYNYNAFNLQNYCSTNTMTGVLQALGDPRIGAFYDTIAGGTFVGRPYGQTDDSASIMGNAAVSQLSPLVLSSTFPGIYMDYAQVQFILAEAVERGYISGTAASYYNNGVTASFGFWGVGLPGGYLAQANVSYTLQKTASVSWQKIIGKQKWISLYMQGMQGWIEWRRLDFGILQVPVGGTLPPATGSIPVRITYPVSEQNVNGKNYAAAVSSQGPDNLDTRVWWDVH